MGDATKIESRRCMVVFCSSRGKIPGISYFTLTLNRSHEWLMALGIDPMSNFYIGRYICSNHFLSEDITISPRGKLLLKPGSIPKINLGPNVEIRKSLIREQTSESATVSVNIPGPSFSTFDNDGVQTQLQPPVSLVSLVKTESLTIIKNEPPEQALEKEISPDIKDIVYHSLSEELIKSETVPENILETKYTESVETQVLVKTEGTSDENVTRGTGQEVIEGQVSNEYSNVLSNLETDAQLVLNFSKDLNGISTRTRKAKQPDKTNFAKCYKTVETTSRKKDKEKIKVIKAPVIPVEAHEYTSLAKDKYVCNHCQHAYNALSSLRLHIKQMHRKLTTMNQCPYCPYKSKWRYHFIKRHIILKHKNTKEIEWFQCNLCEMKFKLKGDLTRHMKVHLRHELMKDGLDLREKRHHCDKCNYKTDRSTSLKRHNLIHLKPEEIQYLYCYHCSYKSKRKSDLTIHIFKHRFKNTK